MHMTRAMTLCLAKRELVHSFETSYLLARTRSTVLVLFRDQPSRSSLGLRALGVSNFISCLLLVCLYPGFLIYRHVSSQRSKAVNCFGVSGFESFKLPSCTFSGVLLPEVDDPSTCVLWNRMSIYTPTFRTSEVFDPMQLVTSFPFGVSGLPECMICFHVVKCWERTHGPIRRVTCVTFQSTFQCCKCLKLTNTWHTSHVSMSSPVTSSCLLTSSLR
jgi:hypothetical protein